MSVVRPGINSKLAIIFIVFLLTVMLALATPGYAEQRHTPRKHPLKAQPVGTPAPQPVAPPVPLTLEQMPTVPPQITFHNGQLTIVAENSTLGDILRGVHTQTGAAVDVPANATERVVVHLGPGPAREVLAGLLNGSHFNYVMLGSVTDPGVLERLILAPKSGSAQDSAALQASAASQPVYTPPQPVAAAATAAAQDQEDISNDDFADDSADADAQPDGQPAPAEDQQAQQQPNGNGQQVIKSPEQLLQDLQRQQRRVQGVPDGFPQPGLTPQQPQPPE